MMSVVISWFCDHFSMVCFSNTGCCYWSIEWNIYSYSTEFELLPKPDHFEIYRLQPRLSCASRGNQLTYQKSVVFFPARPCHCFTLISLRTGQWKQKRVWVIISADGCYSSECLSWTLQCALVAICTALLLSDYRLLINRLHSLLTQSSHFHIVARLSHVPLLTTTTSIFSPPSLPIYLLQFYYIWIWLILIILFEPLEYYLRGAHLMKAALGHHLR